jgi:hypothetical protein
MGCAFAIECIVGTYSSEISFLKLLGTYQQYFICTIEAYLGRASAEKANPNRAAHQQQQYGPVHITIV